jgi:hypothetical protein
MLSAGIADCGVVVRLISDARSARIVNQYEKWNRHAAKNSTAWCHPAWRPSCR